MLVPGRGGAGERGGNWPGASG